MSRLLPKSKPLLVRAVLGGRHHRSSSHHWSIFHFPLVLSRLPTHLVSIPFITCCVFKPLFPLMSLSEMFCYFSVVLVFVLVRDGFSYPLYLLLHLVFGVCLVYLLLNTPLHSVWFSCAWHPCHLYTQLWQHVTLKLEKHSKRTILEQNGILLQRLRRSSDVARLADYYRLQRKTHPWVAQWCLPPRRTKCLLCSFRGEQHEPCLRVPTVPGDHAI